MTNTASLCQRLGGLKKRLFSVTNLHWKTTPTLQQERKEFETREVGSQVEERCSRTNESTTDFVEAKTRNEKTAWWTCERDFRRKYIHAICFFRSHRETCRGIQHIRPCQLSGSSTMIGSRTIVGIVGDPHPGLNSCVFSHQRCFFACRKVNSLVINGGCGQIHLPHTTFHMFSHLTDHTAQMTCVHGSRGLRAQVFRCVTKIGHLSTRHVSPFAARDN